MVLYKYIGKGIFLNTLAHTGIKYCSELCELD